MSGEAQGQVVERRRGGTTRYGFRCTLAGRRHYSALGNHRGDRTPAAAERAPVALTGGLGGGSLGGSNCRSLTPAERALIVLGGGFVAGDPAGRRSGSNRKMGR
jgi:hypothetical protein